MSLLMDPRTLHKLSTLLGAACPSGNKVKVEIWISRRKLSPAALQQARPWRRAGGAWRSPCPRQRFGEIVRAARLSMSVGCLLFGHGWWYRRRQKYFLFLRLVGRPCRCSSQRSLHNAPIFRLLLKVAVKGTHQCDLLNFCGTEWSQRST